MKKAVLQTGGKQYIVQEGETFEVELIKTAGQKIDFEPLLIVDGSNVQVGTPILTKNKVTTEVIEADKPAEKVTAIRYKAKKRVRKVRGHRQHHTILKVTKIV